MVRDAKSKHEIKITNEIKRDKSGKKKWEHINMLTGRKQKAGKDTELYDEQGRKLEIQEGRQKIRETWGDIYKTEVLNITPIDSKAWDVGDIEKTKEEYRERRDRERIEKGKVWIESERPRYTEETLDKGLIKLKKGKSAGLDNIKAETYHAIGKKDICRQVLIANYPFMVFLDVYVQRLAGALQAAQLNLKTCD